MNIVVESSDKKEEDIVWYATNNRKAYIERGDKGSIQGGKKKMRTKGKRTLRKIATKVMTATILLCQLSESLYKGRG